MYTTCILICFVNRICSTVHTTWKAGVDDHQKLPSYAYGVVAFRAQRTVSLPNHKRGCHVVTRDLLKSCPEIGEFEVSFAPGILSSLPSSLLATAVHFE